MNTVDKYITVPLDTIQRINTGELAFLVTALMAGTVVLFISSEYVSESRVIGLSATAFIVCAVLGGWMITSDITGHRMNRHRNHRMSRRTTIHRNHRTMSTERPRRLPRIGR